MASGFNKVMLLGNLGRDPEVRYTQAGGAVCNLRLAVTERRKDGPDGWKDHTEWITVVVFGKTAENAGQYLHKGRQIFVEGRMQTSSYKDKEGVEKWSTEVVAFNVQFLGGGEPQTQGGGGAKDALHRSGPYRRESGNGGATGGKASTSDAMGFVDEDLPF